MIDYIGDQMRQPPETLLRYCRIARKVMLPYMKMNSCIGATKVTCGCLKALGFDPQPLPTKLAVTVPHLDLVFCAGVSAEERATARGQRRVFGHGWHGHLVARVNGWLVDSSLDQAATALEKVALPHEVFVFPLHTPLAQFHARYTALIDNDKLMKIEYVTTDDHSYAETEAWKDDALPHLEQRILEML